MKTMPPVRFRLGEKSDVKDMDALGIDIGGDVVWGNNRVYHVAHAHGELVGYFGLAYLKRLPLAFGSGLAVAKKYRKFGIGSALMFMGLVEARRCMVEWVGSTTMYYNWNFFTNRGWYTIKRSDLFGAFRDYEPFFENTKSMPILRPLGKTCREVKMAGGLDEWLANNKPGLVKLG